MAVLKLSGIASGTTPATTDTFVGVQGGTTDTQYTGAQVIALLTGTVNTWSAVQHFGAGLVTAPILAVGTGTTGFWSASTTGLGAAVNGVNKADFGITTSAIWTFATTIKSAADVYSNNAAFFIRATTALTNGAASGAGTILTAPSSGNPTKWIGIDDSGVTRYIPAW